MDAFERHLFEILRKENPGTSTREFSKWSESSSVWAARNYKQSAIWTQKILNCLDSEPKDVDIEKFFICAFGLLLDLPEFIEKKVGIYKVLGFSGIQEFREQVLQNLRSRGMLLHLISLIDVHEKLVELKSAFTIEDLFALTFYRHSYCHPVLSAYSVKLSKGKGGKVKFDPSRYEAFLKLKPYSELELREKLFRQLSGQRELIDEVRKLLWALAS